MMKKKITTTTRVTFSQFVRRRCRRHRNGRSSRGVADVEPLLPDLLRFAHGVNHGSVPLFKVIFRELPIFIVFHEIDGAIGVTVVDGVQSRQRQGRFARFSRKGLTQGLRTPTVQTTTLVAKASYVAVDLRKGKDGDGEEG